MLLFFLVELFFFRALAGAWLMSEPRKGESEGKERDVWRERESNHGWPKLAL